MSNCNQLLPSQKLTKLQNIVWPGFQAHLKKQNLDLDDLASQFLDGNELALNTLCEQSAIYKTLYYQYPIIPNNQEAFYMGVKFFELESFRTKLCLVCNSNQTLPKKVNENVFAHLCKTHINSYPVNN